MITFRAVIIAKSNPSVFASANLYEFQLGCTVIKVNGNITSSYTSVVLTDEEIK